MIARSLSGRAFRFQLTALVDLLLILLFMQFLELREHQEIREAEYETKIQNIERQASISKYELESDQSILRKALAESRAQLEASEVLAKSYRTQLEKSVDAIQTAFGERKVSTIRDPSVVATLSKELEALANANPDEVVRFLIGYGELLKRAEVWVLHARQSGEIVLQVGDELKAFRLEELSQSDRSSEFADRLFSTFKQIRQPKGLVVMLSSYDLRATAGVYQSMIDGLPAAVDRMRSDSPNIRFEFTVLGPTQDPTIQNNNIDSSE